MDIGGPGVIGLTRNHQLYNQVKDARPQSNSSKNSRRTNKVHANRNNRALNINAIDNQIGDDNRSLEDISQLNMESDSHKNGNSVFTSGNNKETDINVVEYKEKNRATKKDLIFNTFPLREWVFGFA